MDTGICKIFSSLKFFRKISICSKIRKILKKIVKLPSVNLKLRLYTYGIEEIGDVPRLAFVIRLTPSALINNPTKNKRYLFNLFIFCPFFLCQHQIFKYFSAECKIGIKFLFRDSF